MLPVFAIAGNENFYAGARQAGMANCGVTLTDLWSAQHNQAGLANLKKLGLKTDVPISFQFSKGIKIN